MIIVTRPNPYQGNGGPMAKNILLDKKKRAGVFGRYRLYEFWRFTALYAEVGG